MKICGVKREQDIRVLNEMMPDFAGFIFYEKSQRAVSALEAAHLRRLLHPEIQSVGVFVNAETELILQLAKEKVIQMIQLHGNESGETACFLKKESGLPVVKAFRIECQEDVKRAAEFPSDYVLFDHGSGGSGSVFDWELLTGTKDREGKPVYEKIKNRSFLAGGLDAENVQAAIRRFQPFAVDLNSRLETDGKKDPEKIRAAVCSVRSVL